VTRARAQGTSVPAGAGHAADSRHVARPGRPADSRHAGPADRALAAEAWALLCDLVLDDQRRREVSEALGLSFGRIKAVRRIAHQSMPMGALATALGIDAPYMTVVIDDLESRGLVERQPHPRDRRAKVVVATRRGKEAARRADAILGTPPAALSVLDRTDLTDLLRILRTLRQETPISSPPRRPR